MPRSGSARSVLAETAWRGSAGRPRVHSIMRAGLKVRFDRFGRFSLGPATGVQSARLPVRLPLRSAAWRNSPASRTSRFRVRDSCEAL